MNRTFKDIEDLFPGYFSGELTVSERNMVDQWRKESTENEKIFKVASSAWSSLLMLDEMEKYNSFGALQAVNSRLPKSRSKIWLKYFQRIAAILILPLMVYAAYTEITNRILNERLSQASVWQTITTKDGVVSQFTLPDSTRVWLNSGSSLQFPYSFSKEKREIRISGEVYLEVTPNKSRPFIISANKLEIKVLGTILNVINKPGQHPEVILITGKVALSAKKGNEVHELGTLMPNQRAIFDEDSGNIRIERVEVEEFTLWKTKELRQTELHP